MEEENTSYKYIANVCFKNASRSYFFGTNDESLVKDDMVVVETVRGIELGKLKNNPRKTEEVNFNLALKPIIRKATDEDIAQENNNNLKIKEANAYFNASVQDLNLDMVLVNSEYTLDGTKIIFSYLADDRVDFRELLKVLAAKLHCRIELRQIGARDRAKAIGGLGPCGLPMCCSTFLSDFDGISINMAKNQLLALNISKLSGQCGKLICCLKYENDLYSEIRKDLPKINQRVIYHDEELKITALNVLTKTITLGNKEETYILSFEEYQKECQPK